MSAPLKLRARDAEDLAVMSAMVQDALVPLSDMVYLAEDRRFVIALNRYRWDAPDAPSRTHALLTVQQVEQVQTRNLNRHERERILNLLSLTVEDGDLLAVFAGGGLLRLSAETLDCVLEDVGDPWPAQATPAHPDDPN
ncbi:MAG: DUF2948 family protein [Alphaproteobacteria bacterium]|nr:DUF2948 family protein [Alphaproteobacteria bacterium]